MMIIAMYVSGGLIPIFILYKNLKLFNTFWVYIIPNLLSVFNAIIMMNYFRDIPEALEESARIDGANDLQIFSRIILPVAAPIFATIALFSGVMHWNSWFDSAYFVTNKKLKTASYILMELINRANLTSVNGGMNAAAEMKAQTMAERTYTAETIRMATMIVVVIPIICVYPFLQKYFVKGMMVGSIKG
jgi:putative aldouronate transport system permease protein